ncbi:hypothetical protein CDAR_540901 [Caerostris darwini]|uniref:Uncharacterized protein n=1 Tax=Caerostris darwini TaxID=1538125 RepID=A0AAV4VJS9_9ARAC|nr:hypothetical protein CDAR_540901 [Caerostris darwini]
MQSIKTLIGACLSTCEPLHNKRYIKRKLGQNKRCRLRKSNALHRSIYRGILSIRLQANFLIKAVLPSAHPNLYESSPRDIKAAGGGGISKRWHLASFMSEVLRNPIYCLKEHFTRQPLCYHWKCPSSRRNKLAGGTASSKTMNLKLLIAGACLYRHC